MNLLTFILCVLTATTLAGNQDGKISNFSSNSSKSEVAGNSSNLNSNSSKNEVDANNSPSAIKPKSLVSSLFQMSLTPFVLYKIGLDMSKIDGIISVLKFTSNSVVLIEVWPEKLIGFGEISGKGKKFTRASFSSLFDCKKLKEKLANLEKKAINLTTFRALLLEFAKSPEAMIVVDAAILNWIVENVIGNAETRIDFNVMKSVCLLSAHPDISEKFESTITRVLEIFSKNFHIEKVIQPSLNFLLNLLKFIDSHDIREKVKEIVTSLYISAESQSCRLDCRLILGPKDQFLATLEKNLSERAQIELKNPLITSYSGCYFKFYSKGEKFRLPLLFDVMHKMDNHHFIWADINSDKILDWEKDSNSWKNISFAFNFFPSPCLFIVYESSPPSIFWTKIKSCKSLKEFKKLLTTPEIRRIILYYDITILESNIQFAITSHSKQLDNQDPRV